MKWIPALGLFIFCAQAVYSEEVKESTTTKPVTPIERYQPYEGEPHFRDVSFLIGSWSYIDEKVRVVETWVTDDLGDTVGVRKRMPTVPGTRASDEMIDVFTLNGMQGSMQIRRLDMTLHDAGQSGNVGCSSDCRNKMQIALQALSTKENGAKHDPLLVMNYASPNDNELDLEILNYESGSEKREFYKLKRIR